jgi:hypothetical protein
MSRSWPPDPVKGSVAAIVPTNTHIILFRKFPKRWADPCLLVQAFTIPDNQCPVEKEKGHQREASGTTPGVFGRGRLTP